jgi:glycosyltransferase involved in cell wall biosynthesis
MNYYTAIIPSILPLYDAAVYHSKSYKDFEFAENLNLRNGVIIPNAVDEDEFNAPSTINFREKYNITTPYFLLSVGNFLVNKGQESLIEVLRAIDRPEITLVLIGRDMGTLDELKEFASGLNVKFMTDISREDTVAAFKSADLFVFASLVEASPLVIIEAKAARLPFISSECGNVREFKGGLVTSLEEMPIEILNLLIDAPRRKQLAEEGWKEWSEHLTWEKVVDMYEQLYLVLARKKGLVP